MMSEDVEMAPADVVMTPADGAAATADGAAAPADSAAVSADGAAASADGAPVKVKTEKVADGSDDEEMTGGERKPVKDEKKVKDELKDYKVKAEKKDEKDADGKVVKGEGVKNESVKSESAVKQEYVPGKGTKDESVKGENSAKNEQQLKGEHVVKGEQGTKGEQLKGEQSKSEQLKGEQSKSEQLKGEQLKGEHAKGELKGEMNAKGEYLKGEAKSEADLKSELVKAEHAKRERSRSGGKKKKKDKKDGKVKKEKRSPSGGRKKEGKDKKRKRSRSGSQGRKKRKSKWGPDVPIGFTAIPAGRSGLLSMPSLEDTMPRLSDDQLTLRTVILDNLPPAVTSQELIEFFNGAVLAVTANAVQQATHRTMAPVFACSVTEEDRGGGDRRKTAELKFRTPEGASVGMKLNGIEYKGGKVNIMRPEKFPKSDDGQDPSAKINLHEMSMARLVGAGAAAGKPEELAPPVKLSIFNIPDVMTEQIVRDLLSQFGKLRLLSLIRDLQTGKLKGYGIFEYDDSRDVDLAILALNGFVCGQNVIRVQKLGQTAQQAAPKPQPVAATAMSNSMTQKIVSNPVLAMQVKQGREVGSRPSTVVQLMNAVYQEDLMDDGDYDEIMGEIHSEASKHGTVMRVVIPKPAKDGTYIDGVGKIFVSFQDLTASRKFHMEANGRKFENHIVCAAFYPPDKFNEGKYKLWSQ